MYGAKALNRMSTSESSLLTSLVKVGNIWENLTEVYIYMGQCQPTQSDLFLLNSTRSAIGNNNTTRKMDSFGAEWRRNERKSEKESSSFLAITIVWLHWANCSICVRERNLLNIWFL